MDSCDMDHATWLRLALAVQHQLARPEVAGVVVTHGTDTLEETAWFLASTLPAGKPVVLTCAMRPATAREHIAYVALAAWAGAAGIAAYGWMAATGDLVWGRLGLSLIVWGFLPPVFFSVAHRMLPFFTSAAVRGYVAAASDALGGIDVLVNNASRFGRTDDEEGWAASISVDLIATVRASQTAMPHLLASKGSIVHI